MPGSYLLVGKKFLQGLRTGNIKHYRGTEPADGDTLQDEDYVLAWKVFSPALSAITTDKEYADWADDLLDTLLNSEALPQEERHKWLARAGNCSEVVTHDDAHDAELPTSAQLLENQGPSNTVSHGHLGGAEVHGGQNSTGQEGVLGEASASGSGAPARPGAIPTASHGRSEQRGRAVTGHRIFTHVQDHLPSRGTTQHGRRVEQGTEQQDAGGTNRFKHHTPPPAQLTVHADARDPAAGRSSHIGRKRHHSCSTRHHPLHADARRPAGGPLIPMGKKIRGPTFTGERCQPPHTAAPPSRSQVARRDEIPSSGGCKTHNRADVQRQDSISAQRVQSANPEGVQRPAVQVATTRIVERPTWPIPRSGGPLRPPVEDRGELKAQRMAALATIRQHPDSHQVISTLKRAREPFDLQQIKFNGGSLCQEIQNLFLGSNRRTRSSVWKCTVCSNVFIDSYSGWRHICSGAAAGTFGGR
ncbi:unnamed protein product [Ostreobium quekettii]|uniref:Uncharacterized protein n=1 Tax=Ostreobium quekettii TaxID=121088 RepID=A0A8S1IV74_9CHLO|nr:unnamed protein product [Ostreobium quekettii]|eukprot:evm.model.scf_841EXC.2 EVM.evm.TU.scf_841EXC.2   scf_841EXC:10703-15634(-)